MAGYTITDDLKLESGISSPEIHSLRRNILLPVDVAKYC
jgi:hypothetical protein